MLTIIQLPLVATACILGILMPTRPPETEALLQ